MTYELDLYAAPHRLVAVHLVDAPNGVAAADLAGDDLAASGADFAEVFASDGTGHTQYYATVQAASAR